MLKNKSLLNYLQIKNANICSLEDSNGFITYFTKDRDFKGWDFFENISLAGVSNGICFLSADSPAPALSRSTDFIPIDGNIYTDIVLKFKYVKNNLYSLATVGKIYFKTVTENSYTEDKSIEFELYDNDNLNTYNIDMSNIPKWAGYITNLKIVFTTNGFKDDEIFLNYIKIRRANIVIGCDSECNRNISPVFIEDFENSTEGFYNGKLIVSNTDLHRKVYVQKIGTNSQALVVNESGLDFGPTLTATIGDIIYEGYFSLSFKCSEYSLECNLNNNLNNTYTTIGIKINSLGYLEYKLANNYIATDKFIEKNKSYTLIIIFNINTLLYTIQLDETIIIQNLPINFNLGINNIQISNNGNTANNLILDNISFFNTSNITTPCYGAGYQGYILGRAIDFDNLDIIENFNDSFEININNLGWRIIKLTPGYGYSPYQIRDLLISSISNLNSGGYVNFTAEFTKYREYKIFSGTFSDDSSVNIRPYRTSILLDQLGFYSNGLSTYSTQLGKSHSITEPFVNTFKAKSIDLQNLKQGIGFIHRPKDKEVEIGYRHAGRISRGNKLDGRNKTLIDFYNRATNEGRLSFIEFHGVLPSISKTKLIGTTGFAYNNYFYTNSSLLLENNVVVGDVLSIDSSGYIDNGNYIIKEVNYISGLLILDTPITLSQEKNLSYNINNITKIKLYRQDLTGNLILINEIEIGEKLEGSLYTRSGDTYRINVDWQVQKGDLIGIYNPTYIYLGNDIGLKEDVTYLEFNGSYLGGTIPKEVKGYGLKGLGLYGYNTVLQTTAIYDFLLPEKQFIDFITIKGSSEESTINYNLLAAVNNGVNITVTVTGNHTHLLTDQSDFSLVSREHPNIAYNIPSLYDGITHAYNGYLGTFEQTVTGASYFYISGDGEFFPVTYNSDGDIEHNSLEYPQPQRYLPGSIVDYETDPFNILITWNTPKIIDKYAIYFKEFPNACGFLLEYLRDRPGNYGGTLTNYDKIGISGSSEYTKVTLDSYTVDRESLGPDNPFLKHFEQVFKGYVDGSNNNAGGFMVPFLLQPYTVVIKEFDPVITKSVNWHCNNHKSTKISEIELYSKVTLKENLNSILELYAEIEDGEFIKIDKELLTENTIKFKINYPISRLRLVVEPLTVFTLEDISINTATDNIKLQGSKYENLKDIYFDITPGYFTNSEQIKLTNYTGKYADLEVDLSTDSLVNDVILQTSLNTMEDLITPKIGPTGQIIQDENFLLRTSNNVAINSPAYGLKNLILNKKYFIGNDYTSPVDFFIGTPLPSKWELITNNVPRVTTTPGCSLITTNSGFGITTDPPLEARLGTSQIIDAKYSAYAKFYITGNSRIVVTGSYDARRAKCSPISFGVGIIDESEREIYISKETNYYFNITSINNISYQIRDSKGEISDSVEVYNSGGLGIDPIGISRDDLITSDLIVNYITGDNKRVLQFSYLDTINGNGTAQWKQFNSFELDLDNLPTKLIGNIRAFIFTRWNNYPGGSVIGSVPERGNFARIDSFIYGGESTFQSSYDFTISGNLGSNNQFNIDNRQLTNTSSKLKFVAIDLENLYNIEYIIPYSNNYPVSELWNTTRTIFSNSNTDNINNVIWGNSSKGLSRWIMFIEPSIPSSSLSGVKYLDRVKCYPNVLEATTRLSNTKWDYLGDILTDNSKDTKLTNLDYPIICIDLLNTFRVKEFSTYNSRGIEYAANSWANNCYFATSNTNTNNPELVKWDQLEEYPQEGNKPPVGFSRWFLFKFKYPMLQTAYQIGEFKANTYGIDNSTHGEVEDNVDFTFYPNWFTVDYKNNTTTGYTTDLALYENILYGSFGLNVYPPLIYNKTGFVFDDNLITSTTFQSTPGYLWRLFGDPEPLIATSSININNQSFPITTTGYTISFNTIDLSGLKITAPFNTPGVADRIDVYSYIGGLPEDLNSWQFITTFSGLSNISTLDSGEQNYTLNNGEPLELLFNQNQSVSGILIKFSNLRGNSTHDNYSISNLEFLTNDLITKTTSVSLVRDYTKKENGLASLLLTGNIQETSPIVITAGGGFSINKDTKWSDEDYLALYFAINNPDLLDLENSYLLLGKDKDNYFKWSLSQFIGNFTKDLSQIKVKFKNALVKTLPRFNYSLPGPDNFIPTADFINGPITFLQFSLLPKVADSREIKIWFDNFKIIRERFEFQGINKTLFLNNSELLYYPLSNFTIDRGYIEFVMTPLWNSFGRISDPRSSVFLLFTVINTLGETISCHYHPVVGLVVSVFTSEAKISYEPGFLTDNYQNKPIKIGLAWDSRGQGIDQGTNYSIKLWINDSAAASFRESWSFTPSIDSFLVIGYGSNLDSIAIDTGNVFNTYLTSYKLVPNIYSLYGGIENLLVSNSSKKINYNDFNTLKEKIYFSLDGVNYSTCKDVNLPIILYNIGNEETIDIYLKVLLPKNTKNLDRLAYLNTKWRVRD